MARNTALSTTNAFGDNTNQEVITENIKEDSIESTEKVQEQTQEDEPFLCENLFDSCTNGKVFINEVILEDNVNEIIIEQNVNEVTVGNTTDSTVKESVLDNILQV